MPPIGGAIPMQTDMHATSRPGGVTRSRRAAGARVALTLAGHWVRVAALALRVHKTPARAARALWRVRAAYARLVRGGPRKLAHVAGRQFGSIYVPGWPSRAHDRFVEGELARALPGAPSAPPLPTAIVAMTRRCGLACEHCFEWGALAPAETLARDDLETIVGALRARRVCQLFLSGGEPMRRFDDVIALTRMNAHDTDVWVLTSGVGVTAERARALRAAGLTGIAFSLDHWDGARHDAFRGVRGAFAAVARGTAFARDAGLVVALTLCPTRAFVSGENLRRYADVAKALGVTFIQIFEPKAVGHFAHQDVALDVAQQRELERFTAYLNTDPAAREYPSVSYVDGFARAFGCAGAGDRYLYVDTDGAMHPCPFCRGEGISLLGEAGSDAMSRLAARGCPAEGRCAGACAATELPAPAKPHALHILSPVS